MDNEHKCDDVCYSGDDVIDIADAVDVSRDVTNEDLLERIEHIADRVFAVETAVTGFINEVKPFVEDFANSPVGKMIGNMFGGFLGGKK